MGFATAAARVAFGAPEAERMRWARSFAPGAGAVAATALFLGLHRRRRGGPASPTLAWIAKRLALAAAGFGAAWTLTPLSLPAWSLYAAGGIAAVAMGTWLAHLPARI